MRFASGLVCSYHPRPGIFWEADFLYPEFNPKRGDRATNRKQSFHVGSFVDIRRHYQRVTKCFYIVFQEPPSASWRGSVPGGCGDRGLLQPTPRLRALPRARRECALQVRPAVQLRRAAKHQVNHFCIYHLRVFGVRALWVHHYHLLTSPRKYL